MTPAGGIAALVVALLLFLALGWLAMGWLGHWRLNRSSASGRPPDFTFTPWETAAAHEIAAFTTRDGIALHGWFLRHEGERRVIVVMHGYRGEKSDVLGMSTALWRAGWQSVDVGIGDRTGASEPGAPLGGCPCRGLWCDVRAAPGRGMTSNDGAQGGIRPSDVHNCGRKLQSPARAG